MDGLLRSEESAERIEALFSRCFDYEGGLVLFPVRHHSPSCSYHMKKVIGTFQPDILLIEGPENASGLIPHMTADGTKPPFCIYMSFDDRNGKVSGEPDQYRAYYPFLSYSPEYVAIQEAKKRGIPCCFMDLSFGEKLLNTPAEKEQEENREEKTAKTEGNLAKGQGKYSGDQQITYEDERAWNLGDFYQRMIEKTGCRNFSELWDMLFEMDGYHEETKEFVRNLFYYCYYTRQYTSETERLANGDAAREQVMWENIRKAKEKYQKVMAVTGGMHTVNLALALEEFRSGQGNSPKCQPKSGVDLVRIPEKDSKAYLMPYTFEASDQASGYASGMAYPYYYQQVWERMEKRKKTPYEETVLRFIIHTANGLRKKQAISITDEMQSYYMARGLAGLREKKECGVFELLDAVSSSFVKGELQAYHQPALKFLNRLLTGMAAGKVDDGAGVPPIVEDFANQCKRFRIAATQTQKKETRLDIYIKPEHADKSRFFFQMCFLDTGFCMRKGSQEDRGSTGRILLRETWEYRYTPGVQAALINASVYGGTLRQACLSLLKRNIQGEHHTSASLSEILKQASQMGLLESLEDLFAELSDIIGNDMDFVSVMECFATLCAIESRNERMEQVFCSVGEGSKTAALPLPDAVGQLGLKDVKRLCLNRGILLFYTVWEAAKTEEDAICEKIRYLYQYFLEHEGKEETLFLESMKSVRKDPLVNRSILGVCSGVLLKKEEISLDEVFGEFSSYVKGDENTRCQAVSYLKGFFLTARDVVFVDDRMLLLLDEIIRGTGADVFLKLLPDLRLAFTSFLPFEIDRIAEMVGGFYGTPTASVLFERAVDPKELEEAVQADLNCREAIRLWLGGDDGRD